MKGIDISSYQQNVDFNQVKSSGIEIVILKASEGKTWQDSTFRDKYNNAKAAGLKVGAYHFLKGNAVQDEVDNFLSMVQKLPMDCKYIIDAETDLGGIEANSSQIKAFYDILTSKGYDTALYTGEYFYNDNLNDSVKDIPLWVAKYSSNHPNVPSYIGWQYSDCGNVSGISGNVDMNEFNEGILIGNVQPQVKENVNKYPLPLKYNRNVLLFQRAANAMGIKGENGNRLDEDGVPGDNTLYAAKSPKALLKIGMNNPLVAAMQFMFGLNVNSYYDENTYNMVGIFQNSKDLDVDNLVGYNTWIELFKAWC